MSVRGAMSLMLDILRAARSTYAFLATDAKAPLVAFACLLPRAMAFAKDTLRCFAKNRGSP